MAARVTYMVTSRSFVRSSLSALLLACMAISLPMGDVWAVGRKHGKTDDATMDPDRPDEREAYFWQGRHAPAGKNPAELRRQAHEFKMTARAKRAQSAQTSSMRAAADATIPVGNSTTVWRQIGPAPIRPESAVFGNATFGNVTGRVTAVAVDQTDATGNTVYVGGAYGGIWKSTNAAAGDPTTVVWTPLSDDQPTLSVGSIAISPANHNIILVGTGEAKSAVDSYYGLGILRSTDGGATWTLIRTATVGTGSQSFAGLGIGHIAFSADGQTAVASSTVTPVGGAVGLVSNNTIRGLWVSKDAGLTWSSTTLTVGGNSGTASAASVIWNPQRSKFYAAVRYQGIYQSSDGVTWSPTTGQPAVVTPAACPVVSTGTCPFWRGELAMRPGKDEMYIFVVDNANDDEGVYKSTDGGATWLQLDQTGIDNCGDGTGCGGYQSFFNMAIAAVPTPGDTANSTDVYVGTGNWWKCTINAAHPTCATANGEPYTFMNLTHVYGCNGATSNVHPDQHSIDFSNSNPLIVYFGNDGGIYRTVNSTGLYTGSCAPIGGRLPFDNLNTSSLGSLTEYNAASPDPTDPTGFIAGAQDNGTSMTNSSIAVPAKAWQAMMSGDGGHNAINPATPTTFYGSFTNATIMVCNQGYLCSDFNVDFLVDNQCAAGDTTCDASNNQDFSGGKPADPVGGDYSAFYAPFILDPQAPGKMLVGTCRVWRGNSIVPFSMNYPAVATPISYNFSTITPTTTCIDDPANAAYVYSIGAGGPTTANGSQVIYAGYGTGRIARTFNADSGPTSWADITPPSNVYRISDIAVDLTDATGRTAYATIMGFGVTHVWKTTDGTNWIPIGSPGANGLPDAPADAVIIDPDDHTVIYVGLDVGVFVTTNNGGTWTEVGPSVPQAGASSYLPNVVVSHLAISKAGGRKQLIASTYGRGVWAADLVAKTALTVTASNIDIRFGQTLPAYSYTMTGFLNGDTQASATTGAPALTTTPTTPSAIGSYTITATIGSLASSNYTFNFVNGTLTIAASDPVPVLSAISPTSATAGAAAFTLTVNGSNFSVDSKVVWNGVPMTTTYVSAAQLTAVVPASAIATAGSANVTVTSPAPGGGPSIALPFTISPSSGSLAPVITDLTLANTANGGGTYPVAVMGANFASGAIVLWSGATRATSFVNSGELAGLLTSTDVTTVGVFALTVRNPDNSTSQPFEFAVDTPPAAPGNFDVTTGSPTLQIRRGGSIAVPVTFARLSADAQVAARCANLPAGASCSYSNGVVTVTASPETPAGSYHALLVFTATQRAAAVARNRGTIAWSALAILPLGMLFAARSRRKRAWLLLLASAFLMLALAGCGSRSNTSPAVTQMITSQKSLRITLTIQ